jgi:hypothetical protein
MLDVAPTGSVRLNYPRLEIMPETCALDVADRVERGELEGTLDVLGALLGVSRESIRRDEERALELMRALLPKDGGGDE